MVAVSVVLPLFNAERFLGEAVASILAQTFADFELLAIDDGSTDRSIEILYRYSSDARVRVFQRSHRGQPAAMNFGCAVAQGKYIARMDADDISLAARFERQVEFLDRHPNIAILGTQLERIREDGTHIDVTNVPLEHAEIAANMQKYCCMFHPTVMMRAEAVRSLGGYRTAFVAAEDHDLWLRASERFELANLPEILLKYRIHTQSLSFQKLEQQVIAAMAAEVSARLRRAGEHDSFDDKECITWQDLRSAGVSEAALNAGIDSARNWYRARSIDV